MKNRMNRKAFTLAEILITLSIIGVVAALTIPILIQNNKTQATIAAVRKIYSTLDDASRLAIKDNGDPTNWSLENGSSLGAINLLNVMKPYLKIAQNCGYTSLECFPDISYKRLAGPTFVNYYFNNTNYTRVKLVDGTLLAFVVADATCSTSVGTNPNLMQSTLCARIYVDVNGFKQPNQMGVDLFTFFLTKYGIIPAGTEHIDTDLFGQSGCNKFTSNGYGQGCAAWVIENNNMDYTKCSGLSWTGNRSCN